MGTKSILWIAFIGALWVVHPGSDLWASSNELGKELAVPSLGETAPNLNEVGFEQKLGSQLPLDSVWIDEKGNQVWLGKYFFKKPILLVFAYYGCPHLCTLVLNGLVDAIKALPLQLGNQYDIVTVSINPKEKPSLALAKKKSYLARYGHTTFPSNIAKPWHFLTGNAHSIQNLTQSAGFHFKYDLLSKQYNHPSGIIVLSPEGKISQYFFGIQFPVQPLRDSIQLASRSKLGSVIDEILLFCFHYDPRVSKRGPIIMAVIRIAGVLGVFALSFFLFKLFRRENPA